MVSWKRRVSIANWQLANSGTSTGMAFLPPRPFKEGRALCITAVGYLTYLVGPTLELGYLANLEDQDEKIRRR